MKNLFLLLFITFTFATQAATVTWLGGIGSWHNAARWDTGSVPTAADDVVIPTGSVRVLGGNNAFATTIEVQGAARLIVRNNAYLEVAGAVDRDGIVNDGRILCAGDIYVHNITKTLPISIKGITNNDVFVIATTGTLEVALIDYIGVFNEATAVFDNQGSVDIHDVVDMGFENDGTFRNWAAVTISDVTDGSGFLNKLLVNNFADGSIDISNVSEAGWINGLVIGITANLQNQGIVSISNAGDLGINNQSAATILNATNAILVVNDTGNSGIYNKTDCEIINFGILQSNHAEEYGIINFGSISNYDELRIFQSVNTNYFGFNSGASLINKGMLFIDGVSPDAISNFGSIINSAEGYLINRGGSTLIETTGTLINKGFFVVDYNGVQPFVAGTFTNEAVIEDENSSFVPAQVDNQQVIFRPVLGIPQSGVPLPDFLEGNTFTNITIIEWYVDNNTFSPVAGTYDAIANTFTPDAALIGQDYLFAFVQINTSGKVRFIRIQLENPVVPLQAIGGSTLAENHDPNLLTDDFNVGPNPTTGPVQLRSALWAEQDVQLLLVNSLGQVIDQTLIPAGSATYNWSLPSAAPTGVYQLRCLGLQGEVLAQELVVLE